MPRPVARLVMPGARCCRLLLPLLLPGALLAAPVPVTVDPDKGFRLEAGGSWLQVGVLGQFDVVHFIDDRSDLPDGTDFRRLRPNIAGRFLEDWQFRASYELSGDPGVIDAYVVYSGLKPFNVTVGNYVQPWGMEAYASDKANTFLERALPFAFAISRAPGAMVWTAREHWTAAIALVGEPVASEVAGDESRGLTARTTWAPYNQDGRLLHLGLSAYLRKPTQDNAVDDQGQAFTRVRFGNRPEIGAAPRLVDTGSIGGDPRHWTAVNPEFGAGYGPWSLQAEYTAVQVRRDQAPDLDLSGWYVQGTWTLTGEPREYKRERGAFDGVEPVRYFKPGGDWGAWELALRLSELDLNDADVEGGRERNATLGLNAFLNPFVRVSFNAIQVLRLQGGPQAGDTPTVLGLRFQLGF